MHYPKIIFRKSAKRDFEVLSVFIKDAGYDNGRNLRWAIFDKYPILEKYFDKEKEYKLTDKKTVRGFIEKVYRTRRNSTALALIKHKENWQKIAPNFFSLVDSLFGGRKWPIGKYIAFGTIWGMYPRFIKDKTFQIPFHHHNPKYASIVIAHEMLHFMFYDYFYEKYPEYRQSKYNFFVWHVSEIFNAVVQNLPEWLRCFKAKSLSYPEHKKIIMRLSFNFYRCDIQNLNNLLEEIIKEVQSQKLAS